MLTRIKKQPFTFLGLFFTFTYVYFFQGLSLIFKPASLITVSILQAIITILATGFIFAVVLKGEGKSLSSIGFKKPNKDDVLWVFMGFFLGLAVNLIFSFITPDFLRPEKDLLMFEFLKQAPFTLGLVFIITSALSEEVLFRGFAVERLTSILKNFKLASLISWFFFFINHLNPWGIKYTLHLAVFSIVFYFVYARRRNIYTTILMHSINNLAAFAMIRLL
jgi:uncharacterized protein